MDSTNTLETQEKLHSLKEWLTPAELQSLYGIKISTQNKMRMAKTLPYSKVGKFIRYSRTKINQMFKDAEVIK